MAAPQERAAPARERAAPSARRTQPARQGAQRQQASQSTQQTWSGSQVGGFGGGNMGGAGFADSACVGHMGFLFQSNLPTPNCLALDSKAPNTTSASGGFSAGWGTLVPGTRVYAGVEGMWSANRVRNTYTLNQAYPGQFAACCQELTNDTRTATTSIGSSFWHWRASAISSPTRRWSISAAAQQPPTSRARSLIPPSLLSIFPQLPLL